VGIVENLVGSVVGAVTPSSPEDASVKKAKTEIAQLESEGRYNEAARLRERLKHL